jgi:voltage-gated potassium channel
MVYFSLATLGYSDILPSSPFTQMLAVLEAVTGQFFMAVLMAWLVGMFIYDWCIRESCPRIWTL